MYYKTNIYCKIIFFVMFLVVFYLVTGCGSKKHNTLQNISEDGWIELFDGHSLRGWEGNSDFFRVQDSAIVAGHLDKYIPRNEFLCTIEQFTNFELVLEVKLIGQGRNAGIQFRSQRIPNHNEVVGYQCDVGRSGELYLWGALYDEMRRNKMLQLNRKKQPEVAKLLKTDDWNHFRIRVKGNRVQIWFNGFQTVDYYEKDPTINPTGIIGLQIHSGYPSEAWYRNIRIKKL